MECVRTPDERFRDLPGWPFAPRYAEVPSGDGGVLRMHFVDEGPRDAPVVLLLHGEPSWGYLYRKMIPILAGAGLRAVAPDLVGFGRSDKPVLRADYTYQRHVDWMRAFVHGQGLRAVTLTPLRRAFHLSPGWEDLSRDEGFWVFGAMLLIAAIAYTLAFVVYSQGTVVYVFGATSPDLSVPIDSGGIPIRIMFTVDAMSALMEIIAVTVGLGVILYSLSSDERRSGLENYYTIFLLMIAAVLGMVSTGDIFNFFVFLEISSLATAGLVAYRVERGIAVEAGLKYLMVSTIAGIFFLFAIGILYGQYNATSRISSPSSRRADPHIQSAQVEWKWKVFRNYRLTS